MPGFGWIADMEGEGPREPERKRKAALNNLANDPTPGIQEVDGTRPVAVGNAEVREVEGSKAGVWIFGKSRVVNEVPVELPAPMLESSAKVSI
jgi:hypothetical protein